MHASSLAAAALAVAMEDSRSAAVRELMLDRERAAMVAEDRGSFLAQRHYIGSLQLYQPYSAYPERMTWRDAYWMRRDDLRRAHEVMHASLMALRGGDAQRARVVMARVVGEVMPDAEEVEEEPEEDEVMEVEAKGMQSE